ncbi:DeoR/GlpR family DNA-binding transcription regulator [Pseudoalteromonas fenneropenaei]|uniref:DeoR/GlpR family DNA-binding transcription regulator n=1 Tax=Pseudoalteromonas fenneropenaei TaxID=1737459 RepID=A0ABV7CJR8_9GAMM
MLDYASFPDQRQALIKDRLQQNGRVVCVQLAAELNVSEHTIRRDLQELASQGVCKKVYGGAVIQAHTEGSFAQRVDLHADRKQALAKACIRFLNKDAIIFIDTGSTNLAIAQALPHDLPITVVTNAPAIAMALQSHDLCDVILLGGKISKQQGAAIGSSALQQLQTMYFDLCVVGACAVDSNVGLSAFDVEDAQFKQAIIKQSNAVLIAVTEDKLGAVARHKVTTMDSISILVTEANPAKLADFKALDVNIVTPTS